MESCARRKRDGVPLDVDNALSPSLPAANCLRERPVDVLAMGDRLQMVWIDALPAPAQVVYLALIGNVTDEHQVGRHVCIARRRMLEAAVPGRASLAANPEPAAVGRDGDLLQEAHHHALRLTRRRGVDILSHMGHHCRLWGMSKTRESPGMQDHGAALGQTSVSHPFVTLHTETPETASDLQ